MKIWGYGESRNEIEKMNVKKQKNITCSNIVTSPFSPLFNIFHVFCLHKSFYFSLHLFSS